MEKKHIISLVVCACALLTLLFAPIYQDFFRSFSIASLIGTYGFGIFFQSKEGIFLLAAVVGGILGILGGAIKNDLLCKVGPVMGVGGQILMMFFSSDSVRYFFLAMMAYIVATVLVFREDC